MKTGYWLGAALAAACLGALPFAWAGGYSGTYAMGTNGIVAVTNTQVNSVWRPRAVSAQFGDAAARTVTVSRVAGSMDYTVSQNAGVARTFVYEFDAEYWFAVSNVLRVAVEPACTGMVEVICE